MQRQITKRIMFIGINDNQVEIVNLKDFEINNSTYVVVKSTIGKLLVSGVKKFRYKDAEEGKKVFENLKTLNSKMFVKNNYLSKQIIDVVSDLDIEFTNSFYVEVTFYSS